MRNLRPFELRVVTGAGWTDPVRRRIRPNDGDRIRVVAGGVPVDPAAAVPNPQPLSGTRGARDHF